MIRGRPHLRAQFIPEARVACKKQEIMTDCYTVLITIDKEDFEE